MLVNYNSIESLYYSFSNVWQKMWQTRRLNLNNVYEHENCARFLKSKDQSQLGDQRF